MTTALVSVFPGSGSREPYEIQYLDGNFTGNEPIGRDFPFNISAEGQAAISYYNGKLYYFFKQWAVSRLYVAVRSDDCNWSGNSPILFSSDLDGGGQILRHPPASCVHKGLLYIVYADWDENPRMIWYNGISWRGKALTEFGVSANIKFKSQVAIASYEDKLYIFWQDPSTKQINYIAFNGSKFSDQSTVTFTTQNGSTDTVRTDNSPSVVVYRSKLWVIWRGEGDNKKMYYVAYDKPLNMPKVQNVGGTQLTPMSWANPGAAADGDKLLFLYKSAGKDARMFFCTFDETDDKWEHDSSVYTSGSRHWPETDYPPAITGIPYSALRTQGDLARRSTNNWTNQLDDEELIGDVNLPGSHDSVAKTIPWAFGATVYGTQSLTITQQLERGIRAFDIRIRIVYNPGNNLISVEGCHGDRFTSFSLNTYQPLADYAAEMNNFLRIIGQDKETIVVIIKIDDGEYCPEEKLKDAYKEIKRVFPPFPQPVQTMPKLKDLRGKIYVLTRIADNLGVDLGPLIGWKKNTEGEFRPADNVRLFSTFGQDKTDGFSTTEPCAEKTTLVLKAMDISNNQDAAVVCNFCNVLTLGFFGVRINSEFLSEMGKNIAPNRPARFGWCFFDYPENVSVILMTDQLKTERLDLNVIDFIIDSNFTKKNYYYAFTVESSFY